VRSRKCTDLGSLMKLSCTYLSSLSNCQRRSVNFGYSCSNDISGARYDQLGCDCDGCLGSSICWRIERILQRCNPRPYSTRWHHIDIDISPYVDCTGRRPSTAQRGDFFIARSEPWGPLARLNYHHVQEANCSVCRSAIGTLEGTLSIIFIGAVSALRPIFHAQLERNASQRF